MIFFKDIASSIALILIVGIIVSTTVLFKKPNASKKEQATGINLELTSITRDTFINISSSGDIEINCNRVEKKESGNENWTIIK